MTSCLKTKGPLPNMKCAIVYFSQTGNTEKIAKRVQAG
jgi:hypothetical protein